jgi:hypothetical protein
MSETEGNFKLFDATYLIGQGCTLTKCTHIRDSALRVGLHLCQKIIKRLKLRVSINALAYRTTTLVTTYVYGELG